MTRAPESIPGRAGWTVILFCGLIFAASAAAAGETPAPCSAPEHRQFDFWIGEWKVYEGGKQAGTNRIEKILDGCVLQENWSGGSRGTSFNIFDRRTGLWHQTWVDNGGTLLLLDGKLDESGAMVLSGRHPSPKDPKVTLLHRITWSKLPEGKVRQLWRVSPDDGKSWNVVFDGTYVKE